MDCIIARRGRWVRTFPYSVLLSARADCHLDLIAKDGNIIGLIKRHANAVSEYRAGKRLPESNLGKMEVAFQAFISAIHTGGFRTNFLND